MAPSSRSISSAVAVRSTSSTCGQRAWNCCSRSGRKVLHTESASATRRVPLTARAGISAALACWAVMRRVRA